jgi:hypothetical protein
MYLCVRTRGVSLPARSVVCTLEKKRTRVRRPLFVSLPSGLRRASLCCALICVCCCYRYNSLLSAIFLMPIESRGGAYSIPSLTHVSPSPMKLSYSCRCGCSSPVNLPVRQPNSKKKKTRGNKSEKKVAGATVFFYKNAEYHAHSLYLESRVGQKKRERGGSCDEERCSSGVFCLRFFLPFFVFVLSAFFILFPFLITSSRRTKKKKLMMHTQKKKKREALKELLNRF